MTPISRGNRLAGGRTRPLCDPSGDNLVNITQFFYRFQLNLLKTAFIGNLFFWYYALAKVRNEQDRN